jgi:hypothetical protein
MTSPVDGPSLALLITTLGHPIQDDLDDLMAAMIEWCALTPLVTDKLPGQPHKTIWRNPSMGIILASEDGVCVEVEVDDEAFVGELIKQLTWGCSRDQVAAALGISVEPEAFYDTFRIDDNGQDLRVVAQYVRKSLVGLTISRWPL